MRKVNVIAAVGSYPSSYPVLCLHQRVNAALIRGRFNAGYEMRFLLSCCYFTFYFDCLMCSGCFISFVSSSVLRFVSFFEQSSGLARPFVFIALSQSACSRGRDLSIGFRERSFNRVNQLTQPPHKIPEMSVAKQGYVFLKTYIKSVTKLGFKCVHIPKKYAP